MDIVIVAREDATLPNLQAPFRPGHADRDAVERGWRFGIGMADGSKVTVERGRPPASAHGMNFRELADTDAPPRPIILPGGSSGHPNRWEATYWVAPLPPPGPMKVASRWEEAGLPETIYTIEARAILDAAATARPIW